MIDSNVVFDSVRRGYTNLSDASNEEIIDYFSSIDSDEMVGHISNIKGIVFENIISDTLNEQGLEASLFEMTNHPISDICINDLGEIQLKATDSDYYIENTLNLHDDVPIIATSEVANSVDSDMVIDSGVNNTDLTDLVANSLDGVDCSDATDAITDSVSDTLGESVSDTLADSISPIPISKTGVLIAGIKLLFGLF